MMENQACEAHTDNVVGTGDADLATCRALCSYRDDCNFITFFGSESFPFTITACSSAAVILSTSVTTAGQRPKSALRRAARTLREQWENILEVSFDVEEEISCKLLCSLNPSCVVYTHYNASHPTFMNSYFMMRDLNGPFKSCESCKTGCLDCGAKTTTTWDTT